MAHPAAGDQQNPQVAYNPDDDEYLVVWQDYRNGVSNPDIYGQRVSGAGLLAGGNITVNTTAAYRQIEPRLAYGNGRYLVAWRHYPGASDSYYDVYGKLLYADGQPASGELPIANDGGASDRESPTDIVYNTTSGKFLVAWQDEGSGDWDVWGRHVTTGGGLDAAVQLTADAEEYETNAAVAYNPADDEYLVVWEWLGESTGGAIDIAGRRFAGGTLQAVGNPIAIAGEEEDEQAPAVAYLGAAGYAVVWQLSATSEDVYGQAVADDGALVGGNFLIAGEGENERFPRLAAGGSSGTLVLWDRDNGSGGTSRDLYGRYLGSSGELHGAPFTILEDAGQQTSPAAAGDGAGHVFLSWQDNRNGNWDVYGALLEPELDVTVIEYDYDGLYRLTGASYTGAISAAFGYEYDPVGNLLTVTETLTGTTVTGRVFDNANQLTSANDGTTYEYDNNGNLTTITPPNAGPVTAYAYDQRNLLTSATLGGQPLADYLYDGQGNRLQQVDHTGAQPITTTYTNDIVGLSQVLVADDGTAQVVNLFGLDLIRQDDGSQMLTLLADGLGSVRNEMVGSAVQSTTTYEPYGNLLAQAGASGTTYGFTGEQEDAATGLLYLRARYYSGYLNRFLSRDPLDGELTSPMSFNAYMYVYANPATWADPTGRDPHWCEGKPEPERTRCYSSFAGQINPRDLTWWLFDELSTNMNDPRLRDVRALNNAGDVGLLLGSGVFAAGCLTANPLVALAGVPLAAGGAGAHLLAFYEFGELVGDHKPWDFKHVIRDRLGPGITLCSNVRCKPDIEFSTPGNIHFGYVAREAGYAGVYVHAGAGYAEWDDPSHDPPESKPYEGTFDIYVGPSGISLILGDDPSDHPAVQFGVHLYDKYGRGLTRSQFVNELDRFLNEFAESMPAGEVRPDVANDWPYWVGYFEPSPLP